VLAFSLVFGLAFQVPLTEVQNFSEYLFPINPELKKALFELVSPTGWPGVLNAALALVVIAPLFEELLFRGLLLNALHRSSGKIPALALSSVLFGLCHIRVMAALLPACVAGAVLGAIALRTRSTWPAIASHAAINAAPLILSERIMAVSGFNLFSDRVQHVPLPFLLSASAVAAVALLALIHAGGRQAEQEGTVSV
jgi:membrane protease YdiL (CAAX protease family)